MGSLTRNFSNHIYHNDLLNKNDKILLAVSGGLDSLVMTNLFRNFRDKSDLNITLKAAHVNIAQVSLTNKQKQQLNQIMDNWKIEFTIIPAKVPKEVDYGCYPCSKERRKELFYYYDENNFDAIAFGHHKDDYIETGFMNLIRHGHLESLKSLDYMFDGVIKVIRPLLTASKSNLRYYSNQNDIEAVVNRDCKYADNSKRHEIRDYIKMIDEDNPCFEANLYKAIQKFNQQN